MKKGYETEKKRRCILILNLYSRTEEGMTSMLNSIRMINEDIRMIIYLDKYTRVVMRRGKLTSGGDLVLSYVQRIKEVNENTGYKYLGIQRVDAIRGHEVKNQVERVFYRRIRLILKSHLNSGNLVNAINGWAMPVITYTAGIVLWNVAELQELDRKTRKLLAIHIAFDLNGVVHRLYIQRKEDGKGLLQVEQVVREEECTLSEYMKAANDDELIQITLKEYILQTRETKSNYRQLVTKQRMISWLSRNCMASSLSKRRN
jgi:hypothetical protein